MNSILPPRNVGRIPHKIAAGFSGFTAEQWMLWTVLYSPFVLCNKIPQESDHWMLFSQACSLLCSQNIHVNEVDKTDQLLLTFCIYTTSRAVWSTIMHTKHAHALSPQTVQRPLHSFWCFSFERYNGILEKCRKPSCHLRFN